MEKKNLTLTPDEFSRDVIPLIEEGLDVPLKVTGGSMTPYLVGGRDTVIITKPSFPLRRGDIAFYLRESGQIVMHRVCRVKRDGYYFAGDAQTELEGPVREEAVFGVVKRIERKGRTKDGGVLWFLFRKVWTRMVPARRKMIGVYEKMKHKK